MLEKRLKRLNLGVIILPVLQATLVLCMPLVSFDVSTLQTVLSYTLAGLFWASFAVQLVLIVFASQTRQQIERQGQKKGKKFRKARLGLISFFRNKEGMIADLTFVLSIIAVGVMILFKYYDGWLFLIGLLLVFLSFSFHCIFNGKNYRILKIFKNFKKEQKRND